MNEILRKLSSRKLWMAIAGVATGLATIFGVDGGDISNIAGAVVAIASVITYITTEGKVDAESVKQTIIEVQEAVDTLEDEE